MTFLQAMTHERLVDTVRHVLRASPSTTRRVRLPQPQEDKHMLATDWFAVPTDHSSYYNTDLATSDDAAD